MLVQQILKSKASDEVATVTPDITVAEAARQLSDKRSGALVVSQDGAVWVALAGGGHSVGVYEPSGKLRELIEIPLPMCTSVCFGGDDLKDLYIVSGSGGTDSDRAGAVFRVRTGVSGLPQTSASGET